MKRITSLQNPLVKEAVRLRKKSEREKSGLFLVEGHAEFTKLLNAGWDYEHLFICPEMAPKMNLDGQIECTPEVFDKISYRESPDGVLAIARKKIQTLYDFKKGPLYIIAESIEKPGNLGTILRTADAVGVDGLIVCDPCTDIYNPNVVRASLGTLFSVPIVEASNEEALQWLQERHIQTVAAMPEAPQSYTKTDLSKPSAIIVGAEHQGLSPFWEKASTKKVHLPMRGSADSLNVSVATAVLLYEALRQRESK